MSRAAVFGIRFDAVNAYQALDDALDRMSDDGRRPVCQQRPNQWSSDATAPERQDAAAACGFCPAQAACLAYALAQGETAGVWGGRDFTSTTRSRKGAAA